MYQLEQWEAYTETVAQKKMKELLRKIVQSYRDNETEMVENLLIKVKALICKYEVAQKNEQKGELKAIQFSFLHLSVLKGSFEIYIEAFDNKLYLNRNEISEIWSPPIIYEYYEEYVEFLDKKCKQNVVGYSYKENQKLRKKAALDFHAITIRIVAEHAQKIIELKEFQNLDVEMQGIISFGQYMSESYPICLWNIEKE